MRCKSFYLRQPIFFNECSRCTKSISMIKAILFLCYFMFGKKKLERKYKWRLKFASWIFTISQTCNHQYTKDDEKKRRQKYGLYYQKMMIWRIFFSIFFLIFDNKYFEIKILQISSLKFKLWTDCIWILSS